MNIKERLSWWEYDSLLWNVDYTIVGGGIVGLSTAIEIKELEPHAKVLIIDKKSTPLGASTKNAGFACFGSISEILDDYNNYGEEVCNKLIEMRWHGLSLLKSRVSSGKMSYLPEFGAEIFENEDEVEYYKDHLSWANALVTPIIGSKECYKIQKGSFGEEIVNQFEGSLNPKQMIGELDLIARNLNVQFLEGVDVNKLNLEKKCLESNHGDISYKKLIVCTNGFSRLLLPNKNINPARNQVLITKKIPNFSLDFCYHMNKGYVYFREFDQRLLIGGGRHLDVEGETTEELNTTNQITSYLTQIIQKYIIPNHTFEIEHQWSGILGVGDTKMPMVEKVDEDVLVAVRMGGMGVAIGSFIGKVAAGMIQSNSNTALELYVR